VEAPAHPPARLARLLPALAALLAFSLWVPERLALPWALPGGDESEYADVGRHLARGEGFTTGIVYPAELDFGVGPNHPSLVRPPFWPLALGAAFAVFGPAGWVVHVTALGFHLGTVAAATALGTALAGPWIGALAGVATATSWPVRSLALLGGTEPAFAFWMTLAFLLLARRRHPFWIGLACGLAYLTRYNGLLLEPIALALLLRRRDPLPPLASCAGGFLAVVLPWWVRNLVITGNPLFSLYNLLLYAAPGVTSYTQTLLHMVHPDLESQFAMAPAEKVRLQLPEILRYWPPASGNLAACIGVAVACVRRDRLALGWLAFAAATTLSAAVAFARGRYFAPLLPVMLALGAAAWARHGGRLRLPALALVLLAPLLPAVPREARDIAFFRTYVAHGGGPAPHVAWAPCLTGHPLVVAEDAPLVNWVSDTTTIWLPATEPGLIEIVDRFPVDFVQVRRRKKVLTPRFEARFAPRPDCGPTLFQRRVRMQPP
jgi:4-amino-4-deoxy-L-arabinose transferase-like glycosyltransferase